jgi:hypothetical protein
MAVEKTIMSQLTEKAPNFAIARRGPWAPVFEPLSVTCPTMSSSCLFWFRNQLRVGAIPGVRSLCPTFLFNAPLFSGFPSSCLCAQILFPPRALP